MMLGSAEKAEDVTHDCFVSLIQNSKKFDPSRASLRMYLYSATRNLAAKSFCDTASEVALDDLKAARVSGTSEQPLRNLLHQELSGEIQKAISQMPPLQREVVVLFEYQEQSLTWIRRENEPSGIQRLQFAYSSENRLCKFIRQL
jgi:RNA polymerase sigma factor (sigma-70 family)